MRKVRLTCRGAPNTDYMYSWKRKVTLVVLGFPVVLGLTSRTRAERAMPIIFPEQRRIEFRDPGRLPRVPLPNVPPPPTVSDPEAGIPVQHLTLDEAIRIALENSEVVRVLAGVGAVSSGRTIYDPAITNTTIDEQKAIFDPTIAIDNTFNRFEEPSLGIAAPLQIGGTRTDDHNMHLELRKQTTTGGVASLGVNTNPRRLHDPDPFSRWNRSSAELGFRQPLLRGGGIRPNLAPIVLARIDTERSFFQLKDSLQDLVLGVIEAYWALIFARTDQWAREQQVEQGESAYVRALARKRHQFDNAADVAQTHLALAGFRAAQITAQADVLEREAALLNILGLPPSEPMRPVPVTPMSTDRIDFDWGAILALAEQRRPDLIELKLIIEADQQRLLMARNQALPQVDAVMLYRWNGLEGTMPAAGSVASLPGQFTDWTLGVNFSVPLGLRESRAALRRQELVIVRDRANLQQGLHGVTHVLAASMRDLALFFEQYDAFTDTRAAARTNLRQQAAEYQSGLAIFLNVLQAMTSWGNAVSSQAQALAQYNSELANLERQTGTILESHGIRLFEERFASIGPLGRLFSDRCYPSDVRPGPNTDQYPAGTRPAEQAFDLETPFTRRRRPAASGSEALPPPARRTPSVDDGP